MSDSRRARTVRRLTGGVLLARLLRSRHRAGRRAAAGLGWRQRQRHLGHRRRRRLDAAAAERADDGVLEPQSAELPRRRERLPHGRHSVPDDRREDHRRRLARLVHDQERRPDLAHAPAARLSAGRIAGRPRVAAQGIPRRRRSDHSSGHERAVLLRRPRLRPRRRRRQRDLRRALHRQQQPGRHRRRADRLSRRVDRPPHRRAPPSSPSARAAAIVRQRASHSERAARARTRAQSASESSEAAAADSRRRRTGRARPSRWSTSRGWPSTSRAPARRCARSAAPEPACRCRRSPAAASTWRTRSSTARAKSAAGSCSAARPTAA